MINLITYIAFLVGNILTLLGIPDQERLISLKIFSMFGLIVGPIIIYSFSKEKGLTFWKSNALKLAIFLLIISFIPNHLSLIVTFCCSSIVSDYLASQTCSKLLISLYRVSSFLLSVIIFFNKESFAIILQVRVALFLILALMVKEGEGELRRLQLSNTFAYLLLTHLFYFGPLYIIASVLPLHPATHWYIGTQIGLSIILRAYDLVIRGNMVHSSNFIYTAIILSMGVLVVLSLFDFQAVALSIFLASIIALSSLRRFVHC